MQKLYYSIMLSLFLSSAIGISQTYCSLPSQQGPIHTPVTKTIAAARQQVVSQSENDESLKAAQEKYAKTMNRVKAMHERQKSNWKPFVPNTQIEPLEKK